MDVVIIQCDQCGTRIKLKGTAVKLYKEFKCPKCAFVIPVAKNPDISVPTVPPVTVNVSSSPSQQIDAASAMKAPGMFVEAPSSLRSECPSCQQPIIVRRELIGKRVRCAHCGQAVPVVDIAENVARPRSAAAAVMEIPVTMPSDGVPDSGEVIASQEGSEGHADLKKQIMLLQASLEQERSAHATTVQMAKEKNAHMQAVLSQTIESIKVVVERLTGLTTHGDRA